MHDVGPTATLATALNAVAERGAILHRDPAALTCAVQFGRRGVPHLAIGTDRGEVLVLALGERSQLVATLAVHGDAINALAWGSAMLFVACADGTVSWHNGATLEEMFRAPHAHPRGASAAVALGDRGFASVGRDGLLRLWLAQGAFACATGHPGPVCALAASPCGRWLASASAGGTVVVFDCRENRFGAMRRIGKAGIGALCWSARAAGFIAADHAGALHAVRTRVTAAAPLAA